MAASRPTASTPAERAAVRAGAVAAQLAAARPGGWGNWAGTQRWRPGFWHEPRDVDGVRAAVAAARAGGGRLKVAASGHSPNDMAVGGPGQHLLSLARLNRVLEVAADGAGGGHAVCEAGVTLAQLNRRLASEGLAMPCLGSISAQQLGGVLATGTHGTGASFGVLASAVEWVELVDGRGRLRRCSRDEEPALFSASLVHLGALGVLVAVRLRVERAFRLREVSEPSTLREVLRDVDAVAESAEHARFWWFPHTDRVVVTRQDRTEAPATPPPLPAAAAWVRDRAFGFHGLQAALYASRAVPSLVPRINRLYGWALFGRRRERVARSDEVFNFDCLFQQHVNEWAIPRSRCAEALRRLRRVIRDEGLRVHFPVEVRFVRGDDIWLSPAHGRDTCYIGVIMYRPYGRDAGDYRRYFAAYERIMLELGGRPHWAKAFSAGPEALRGMYPRWDDFCRVRDEADPDRVFANAYTDRVFGEDRAAAAP